MTGIILDSILMLLLVAAIGYGIKLERKLKTLREGQLAFAAAVTELNSAAGRAEQALATLRASGQETDLLHDRIIKARAVKQELEVLIARAPARPAESRIETREDEDQVHAARIYGKRIRYLLAPLRAEIKGCDSVVRRLQKLQDLLGDYHDAQVFGDLLRKLVRKAATEQADRWLELMLNAAPDARALARERKQDVVTGVLLVARLIAKRKEKLLQQLGQMQAQGHTEQLLHDIAMLATGLAGQPDVR